MKKLILLLGLLMLGACSTEPQPLRYGEESCSFCKMGLSDKRFGAEIITNKGKVYKYDAIECMLKAVKAGEIQTNEVARYLVVDADKPETLVTADDAYFLISEALPSPMGENISSFSTDAGRSQALAGGNGKNMSWQELKSLFGL